MPGASSFAPGEGAFVVSFTSVNTEMAGKVTAGGETTFTSTTNMFFLWARLRGCLGGLVEGGRGGGWRGSGLARIGEILGGVLLGVDLRARGVMFCGVTGHLTE